MSPTSRNLALNDNSRRLFRDQPWPAGLTCRAAALKDVRTIRAVFVPAPATSYRARPDRPQTCLRGELFLSGGFELAHIYENITDASSLRSRYEERLRHRIASGLPPVALDEGLLGSAALGMPPMAGIAIGLDRLLLLVLGEGRVGDGSLFPREGFPSNMGVV
jgi:elongation factor P--beta-lysine ligase